MSSIFDLKTNISELSQTNNGVSRLSYDQVQATRDVTRNNFSNGVMSFKWSTSSQKWWMPSRSYFRMRAVLTRGDNTQFTLSDNVAPSMNLMANLWQSAELRLNGKTLSRISNYMSQIESIENRLNKSRSQMEYALGSTNFMQASFFDRQNLICSDGLDTSGNSLTQTLLSLGFNAVTTVGVADTGIVTFTAGGVSDNLIRSVFKIGDYYDWVSAANSKQRAKIIGYGPFSIILEGSGAFVAKVAAVISVESRTRLNNVARKMKSFELCWTPCLSIFKLPHALPSGDYEILLSPYGSSVYQLQAIESRNQTNFLTSVADVNLVGAANAVKFLVEDMYFYCNTVDGPRVQDMSYLLDLNQTACQAESNIKPSFGQRQYDVSPSTYALSVAFQDGRAIQDTRASASLFKCFDTTFNLTDVELTLNRLYVSYAGISRPIPDADPLYVYDVTNSTDKTAQQYIVTMIENGSFFDTGSAESIVEYQQRGSYTYLSFAKDGSDRSTRVQVNTGFSFDDALVKDLNCLLFSHSKQVAKITIQNGMVIDVQIEDA